MLVPGSPLAHPDHAWLHELLHRAVRRDVARALRRAAVRLARRGDAVSCRCGRPHATASRSGARSRRYRSQLPLLGMPAASGEAR